jgi:hypothetical protein
LILAKWSKSASSLAVEIIDRGYVACCIDLSATVQQNIADFLMRTGSTVVNYFVRRAFKNLVSAGTASNTK